MLTGFFLHLRQFRLPVSIKEYLLLLESLKRGVIGPSVEEFYHLARACLVKDERHFDRFDLAFGSYFKGVEAVLGVQADVPLEWLRKRLERELTEEEKALVQAMGGFDKLMERLRELLETQKGRHEGGSRWIGTAGTSPFGAYGFNPEGVRIGQERSRNRSAVKVWDQRAYRDYDDTVELGTRNIKVALRKLRKFAREGAREELDLDDTIRSTARNAGWLDLKMRPERHNAVKVLLFLDSGGSMDDHVRVCEELFSAARAEFKHLEHFYFHNCLYDFVWKNNRRRHDQRHATWEVLNKYGREYRVVFVGDASMAPYELTERGGSIEYENPEPGATWLSRMVEAFPRSVWLNPEPEEYWNYRPTIQAIRRIFEGRMFPMTLHGLGGAIAALKH